MVFIRSITLKLGQNKYFILLPSIENIVKKSQPHDLLYKMYKFPIPLQLFTHPSRSQFFYNSNKRNPVDLSESRFNNLI